MCDETPSLFDILTRYENAMVQVHYEQDDSEAAQTELSEARQALLTILREALGRN
jgi:hypothetical protein